VPNSQQIRQTLKYSIRDGQFWGVMNGFGTSYLSAFVVFLGGTAFQLGMLASVPQLLASISQLFAVRLVSLVGSRKRFIILASVLQATSWLGAAAVAVIGAPVPVVIGLACLFFIFGMLCAPAWSSLIGDLVPENQRGRYFGKRNRSIGLVSFVAMVAAGVILDALVPEFGAGAYAVLFGVAFVGRMVSVYFLAKHYDPQHLLNDPEGESASVFLRNLGRTDFGRLTRFNTVFHIATFIVSPLFVVYFLEYLEVTYWQYSVMLSAAAISNFLTMRYWGMNADRFGNRVVLNASSWVLAVFPFVWFAVWFLPKSLQFPVGVGIQIVGGLAWAGYNLSVSNFQFDTVEPEFRVRRFGHYHLMHGLSMFIGGMIGGVLADSVNFGAAALSGIFFVMLLSGVLRLAVCFVLLPGLRELRKVSRRPFYLYFLTVMPVEGLHADVMFGYSLTKRGIREKLREIEKKMDWSWLDRRP
jgi:MFS family permease